MMVPIVNVQLQVTEKHGNKLPAGSILYGITYDENYGRYLGAKQDTGELVWVPENLVRYVVSEKTATTAPAAATSGEIPEEGITSKQFEWVKSQLKSISKKLEGLVNESDNK